MPTRRLESTTGKRFTPLSSIIRAALFTEVPDGIVTAGVVIASRASRAVRLSSAESASRRWKILQRPRRSSGRPCSLLTMSASETTPTSSPPRPTTGAPEMRRSVSRRATSLSGMSAATVTTSLVAASLTSMVGLLSGFGELGGNPWRPARKRRLGKRGSDIERGDDAHGLSVSGSTTTRCAWAFSTMSRAASSTVSRPETSRTECRGRLARGAIVQPAGQRRATRSRSETMPHSGAPSERSHTDDRVNPVRGHHSRDGAKGASGEQVRMPGCITSATRSSASIGPVLVISVLLSTRA